MATVTLFEIAKAAQQLQVVRAFLRAPWDGEDRPSHFTQQLRSDEARLVTELVSMVSDDEESSS